MPLCQSDHSQLFTGKTMKYKTILELIERMDELIAIINQEFKCSITPEDIRNKVDNSLRTHRQCHENAEEDLIFLSAMASNPAEELSAEVGIAYLWCRVSQDYAKNNCTDKAAETLRKASDKCEELDQKASSGFGKEMRKEKRRAIASAGGVAKSEKKYKPIKIELRRLLEAKKPDGGWESKAAAVRAVLPEIAEYQVTLGTPLKQSGLNKRLTSWLASDAELAKVFDHTKRI